MKALKKISEPWQKRKRQDLIRTSKCHGGRESGDLDEILAKSDLYTRVPLPVIVLIFSSMNTAVSNDYEELEDAWMTAKTQPAVQVTLQLDEENMTGFRWR